jgi:hypothetical protein
MANVVQISSDACACGKHPIVRIAAIASFFIASSRLFENQAIIAQERRVSPLHTVFLQGDRCKLDWSGN